jgi:hypothetical protein
MLVRSAHLLYIRYGFADASGTGLGASVTTNQGVRVRIGTWGKDSEAETSNWREFENLVTTLESEGQRGNLEGAVVVMCTDNSKAEAATNKASSTSPKLYRLAVRLRALQFRHGAQFIASHIAGERMKDQGTDGISRGHLKEGIAVGNPMIKVIPFHKSALTSSTNLKAWLKSWAPAGVEFLEPEGWFERGHDQDGGKQNTQGFWTPTIRSGTFVWTPPLAAARIALEQLRVARIKRQNSLHIVCIPLMLSHEWSRLLWKAADVVFEVPIGASFWPENCFESLTIGLLFPYAPHSPWQLRRTPKMFYVARKMRELLPAQDVASRDFLRQLYLECRGLSGLSKGMVWRMLHFEYPRQVPRPDGGGRAGRKRERSVSPSVAPTGLEGKASRKRRFSCRMKR